MSTQLRHFFNYRTVAEANGAVMPSTTVRFYNQAGSAVAVFDGQNPAGSSLGSSVVSDSKGLISVWLDPGIYSIRAVVSGAEVELISAYQAYSAGLATPLAVSVFPDNSVMIGREAALSGYKFGVNGKSFFWQDIETNGGRGLVTEGAHTRVYNSPTFGAAVQSMDAGELPQLSLLANNGTPLLSMMPLGAGGVLFRSLGIAENNVIAAMTTNALTTFGHTIGINTPTNGPANIAVNVAGNAFAQIRFTGKQSWTWLEGSTSGTGAGFPVLTSSGDDFIIHKKTTLLGDVTTGGIITGAAVTSGATGNAAGQLWRTNDLVKTTSSTDRTSGRVALINHVPSLGTANTYAAGQNFAGIVLRNSTGIDFANAAAGNDFALRNDEVSNLSTPLTWSSTTHRILRFRLGGGAGADNTRAFGLTSYDNNVLFAADFGQSNSMVFGHPTGGFLNDTRSVNFEKLYLNGSAVPSVSTVNVFTAQQSVRSLITTAPVSEYNVDDGPGTSANIPLGYALHDFQGQTNSPGTGAVVATFKQANTRIFQLGSLDGGVMRSRNLNNNVGGGWFTLAQLERVQQFTAQQNFAGGVAIGTVALGTDLLRVNGTTQLFGALAVNSGITASGLIDATGNIRGTQVQSKNGFAGLSAANAHWGQLTWTASNIWQIQNSSGFQQFGCDGSNIVTGMPISTTAPITTVAYFNSVSGGYLFNGTQVVGARGAAVANAAAGTEVATINAILARLRAHGLIAS